MNNDNDTKHDERKIDMQFVRNYIGSYVELSADGGQTWYIQRLTGYSDDGYLGETGDAYHSAQSVKRWEPVAIAINGDIVELTEEGEERIEYWKALTDGCIVGIRYTTRGPTVKDGTSYVEGLRLWSESGRNNWPFSSNEEYTWSKNLPQSKIYTDGVSFYRGIFAPVGYTLATEEQAEAYKIRNRGISAGR